MVGISYDQKPYRKADDETWAATVHRSPSDLTEAGRVPGRPLIRAASGIAISEAVEVAAGAEDTNYSLGSVLDHVCLHQTVIGQECIKQMEIAASQPHVVIGCVGGGSNFARYRVPVPAPAAARGHRDALLGAEPAACPTLTAAATPTTSATPSA